MSNLPGWIVSWKLREGIHIEGDLPPENAYYAYAEDIEDVLRCVRARLEQGIPFTVGPGNRAFTPTAPVSASIAYVEWRG